MAEAEADPFRLDRFVGAQEGIYEQALAELRRGRKASHWMWFIFPQYEGLGYSGTARFYAIKSRAEAAAFLKHPVLGPRLLKCVDAVLSVTLKSAHDIFGSPDDLKLRSSATLFARVSPPGSPFHRIIDRYYGGGEDERTLELMESTKQR